MTNVSNIEKLPVVREPTMYQIRKILAEVEGHFDEAKGCYTGNMSDDAVAIKLQLPPALVARVREESGLKIKGNPEVIKLRADLTAANELLMEMSRRLDRLERRA